MNQNPIIIALDVDSAAQAREIVQQLDGTADFFKVGLELYAATGMSFVDELLSRNKRVFLDLKLYDIPETVKRAVAKISQVGVTFLTVHARTAVMRAALEGLGASKMQLLAVTVLTSFDDQDLAADGHSHNVRELVALRVRNAINIGVRGIVCSPLDAAMVRKIAGREAVIVTPGVRSRAAAGGDQKRIASPAEAITAGANYLVIGREVTRAADPEAAVQRILADLTVNASAV